MLREVYFLLLVFTFTVSATAQDRLTVHVFNKESGAPVEYAYVSIYQPAADSQFATGPTDEEGYATLSIGTFPLEVRVVAFGFDPQRIVVKSFPGGPIKVAMVKRFASLDEVVVTGVPRPTRPQNALANYKVISAATIQSQGAVTLNEVLSNQLNINMSNDGVLGAQVRMQGLGGDKVKTLIDGVSLNGREGGNIDMGQVNLYNVERVEIVQGPMSIMYGSDALGGVINVIEKQNKKPWQLQAAAHYETIGRYNVNLGGSRNWKRHGIDFGGGRNYFDGWNYIDPPISYGGSTLLVNRQLLFKPKEQYMANAGYSYTALSGFKVRFASDFLRERVTNKGSVSTYDPYRISAVDEYYNTTRSLNRLALEGKLGRGGSWQMLNGYTFYRRLRNSYIKDMVTLEQSLSPASGVQDTSTFADISSRGYYTDTIGKYDLTVGYDIVMQNGKSTKIAESENAINDYALFALFTAPFFKDNQFKVQLGVRASYNTQYNAPVIPAVNLLYSPGERLQLRGSYAKGFRAPSLKELYLTFIDNNHRIIGNTDLKSETGDHIQVSASYQFNKGQSNYAQLIVTSYYNDVQNGIVLVPLRPWDSTSIDYSYGNVRRQRNSITTTQYEGQFHDLHYMLGYSFIHTFAETGEYDAFNAHEFSANLSYYLKVLKMNFAVFHKFTGSQPALVTNIDGSATYSGKQDSYHMMNASVDRRFWKGRVQVIAGVKNLLDVQTRNATGLRVTGMHSGNGSLNLLPRSIFTTLRLSLN